MKRICVLLSLLCVSSIMFGASFARAEDAAPAQEEATPKRPRSDYFNGSVVAVDAKNMTINVKTGKEAVNTFKVTAETKIFHNEKEIALADVPVGKFVRLSSVKQDDQRIAKRITVLDQAPEFAGTTDFSGSVTAVDKDAKTIEVQTSKTLKKTFAVVETTKIFKDEKEFALANIAVGNFVKLLATSDDAGKLTAKKVVVFDKEPEKKAEGAKASATVGIGVGGTVVKPEEKTVTPPEGDKK